MMDFGSAMQAMADSWKVASVNNNNDKKSNNDNKGNNDDNGKDEGQKDNVDMNNGNKNVAKKEDETEPKKVSSNFIFRTIDR